MRRIVRAGSTLALCCAVALLFSCQKSEEPKPAAPAPQAAAPAPQAPAAFQVTSIDLGNAIGTDKKVAAPSTSFKPSDTIYASIVTVGSAPSVTLKARWTYKDGQLVSESSQSIAPTGPAATEFHIAKPDGWPAGKYTLEVAANGTQVGTREFTVVD